jgi:hypothetical protein
MNFWPKILILKTDEPTQQELAALCSERLFSTHAYFCGWEALATLGHPEDGTPYNVDKRRYHGVIMADNIEEAEIIANIRGLGEVVDGLYLGFIPEEDYDSFKASVN